jgi:hypothetical protein
MLSMGKSGCTFFMGMDMLLERKVERMLPWIILLCIVGLALVFAEMLIPGFGVFGILGSVCLLGTAFLVAKVYGITAFLITVVLLVIAFALMIVLAKKSGFYNKVVLRDKQEAQDFDESTLQGLLGVEGVTQTTLRPFGVADFQGKMVDVCSNGDFIDRGKRVRVTQIQGKTVTVAEC